MLGTLVDGDVGVVCTQGTPNMEQSKGESRVFTPPKGLPFCPSLGLPSRSMCAVERTKAEAFGGVRRPAGKQAVQQARRKPAGEHSRRRAPKEHSRRRAPKEHSGTEHRDRSSDKVFTKDFSRGSSPGQDLQRSSSKKLFKEALQRSSSGKLFKEALH
jgi:hypothetical protein